jgi:hypothetical protein
MITIHQYMTHPKFVIPEARFCEARNEPTKPAIWDPGATKQELPYLAPGSQIFINLVASPQFMNSGMTKPKEIIIDE